MKNIELAKKLAVLGVILNSKLISEEEYNSIKKIIMNEYDIVSFISTE